ncbi:MAG: hypothetical protein ACO3XO_05915, partial [Bdellovibrionota bacterium]
MPGSIGKNRGIAVEGTSSEAALRTVATPGGIGEQKELMAEFSHLLDQIAVEVERVADVNPFLKNQTALPVKTSEERFSRLDNSQQQSNMPTGLQTSTEKSSDSNSRGADEPEVNVESSSIMKTDKKESITGDENHAELHMEDSAEDLVVVDELVSEEIPAVTD